VTLLVSNSQETNVAATAAIPAIEAHKASRKRSATSSVGFKKKAGDAMRENCEAWSEALAKKV